MQQRVELVCHPDTPARRPISIGVQVAVSEYGQLVLSFELRGDLAGVVLPKPVTYAERRDGLWQTSCFEAFVLGSEGRYVEVNLSPSTAWAVYAFEEYRGDPAQPVMDAPQVDVDLEPDLLRLTAAVDLSAVGVLAGLSGWRVNLTAVIEEADGTKSYWALAHPAGKPDFHHPDGFVLDLSPPV